MEWLIQRGLSRLFYCVYIVWTIASAAPSPSSFVATECYGSVLRLGCSPGHRIKVLDDFFGVSLRRSGPGQCRYQPGDCTVTNSRFTSVIHRYCEGKQTCASFQVDRRHCGANHTNYEQVEYECVPDSEILDMCRDKQYRAPTGYISTPNFPHEYPPSMDCACSLRTSSDDTRIRLEATHFIVKFDSPCKDWLEIKVGGRTRRLCGAYKSTLKGSAFNLTFHSDMSQGHQGVWMYYSVYPRSQNATVAVQCSRIDGVTSTTFSPTTTTRPLTTTTTPTTEETVLPEPPSYPRRENSSMLDGPAGGINSDLMSTSPQYDDTSARLGEPALELDDDVIIQGHTADMAVFATEVRKTTLNLHGGVEYREHSPVDYLSELQLFEGRYTNESYETEIFWEEPSFQGPRTNHIQRTDSTKTTGVLVISICVAGIVLLAFILAILMCINRSRQPKRLAAKERKRRLQQRLNSLSFYDSIPLYDSVGRRSGTTMVRLPGVSRTVPMTAGSTGSEKSKAGTLPSDHSHTSALSQLNVKGLTWPKSERGPCYTSTVEPESDHDSAIYAELDKQSRGATSEDTSTLSPVTRTTPNGEGPPGYAVHLKHTPINKEDIYTHV